MGVLNLLCMIDYQKLFRTKDVDLIKEFPGHTRKELREIKSKIPISALKVLVFDVETSQMKVKVWQLRGNEYIEPTRILEDWFMVCWAGKWLNGKSIGDRLTPREAKACNDKRIIKSLWSALNEADIVIAHNGDCVHIDTPILTSDLTWVKAGDLKNNVELVSFDEGREPGYPTRDKNKQWKTNKTRLVKLGSVKNYRHNLRDCVEIVFGNGDRIITTKNHYWLGMAEKDKNHRWYRAENLRVGQRVIKYMNPWQEDNSYEAGWLSGFISGEGTLKGGGASIDFCQRPGRTMEQSLKYAKKLGIDMAKTMEKSGGLGRGDTLYTYSRGGKWKTLETLGKLRIERLIDNLDWKKFGCLRGKNLNVQTIVEVNNVGLQPVAEFETTSKTYFAGGYPMHNSFDILKANTRFLKYGAELPKYYKTIDTLKLLRKNFKISSNKLDYACKFIGVGGKLSTGGIELWDKSELGDEQALSKMFRYCLNDVKITEKLFLKLIPYIKNLKLTL